MLIHKRERQAINVNIHMQHEAQNNVNWKHKNEILKCHLFTIWNIVEG